MSLDEFLKDIYRMPDPEWFSNRWGQIVKEWSEKAEKFDRYNLHKISLEENGVWGAINKLDAKIEAIKPLVLELFNHADHGLDSHNPRSFEIRQLRDKIIRTLGETQA